MNFSTLVIMLLSTALSLSLISNGVLVWYIKKLVQNIVLYTEGVDSIRDSLDSRLEELNNFSRKELILNDPDIAFVINVIKESQQDLEEFRNNFTIVDTIESNVGEEDEQ